MCLQAKGHQELPMKSPDARTRGRFSLTVPEGTVPADTLTLYFQHPRLGASTFLVLMLPSVCCYSSPRKPLVPGFSVCCVGVFCPQ